MEPSHAAGPWSWKTLHPFVSEDVSNCWNLCGGRSDSWTSSCISSKYILSLKILRATVLTNITISCERLFKLSPSWLPLTYGGLVHEGHSTTCWSQHLIRTEQRQWSFMTSFCGPTRCFCTWFSHDLSQSAQGLDVRLGQIEKNYGNVESERSIFKKKMRIYKWGGYVYVQTTSSLE